VVVLPDGYPPGSELVVQASSDGSAVAITVPNVPSGHVIVVDMGDDLRTWGAESEQTCGGRRMLYAGGAVFLLAIFALVLLVKNPASAPHYSPGSYSPATYGPSYNPATYGPSYNPATYGPSYSPATYGPSYSPASGASSGAYIESSDEFNASDVNASQYPGFDEGFERGVDESGQEIYRYEQNNQVYVIPGDQYYAWRAEYHHGSLTHEILQILLIGHLFHLMTYPRGLYYGSRHFFGPATTPYYSSAGYRSRFAAPSTVGGRVVHRTAGAARPSISSAATTRAGTALGRPMAATPAAHSPVVQNRPVSSTSARPSSSFGGARPYTPVAQARPVGAWHGSFRRGRG